MAGRRRLTPSQQKAVDEMVSLGASLGADFTIDELRGAYRQLARRYHPDVHPSCSEREKARLSALFTRAHDSYQILLQRHAA
jgi:DnaJ-class molecular chaperone